MGQTFVAEIEDGLPKVYDLPISLAKVQFEIADSVSDYTLFLEPDGKFYFSEGFEHDEYSAWSRFTRVPIEGKFKRKESYEGRNYKDSYHWSANTIHSVSRFEPFNDNQGNFVNTYDFEYEWYPFIHELTYTAIQDSLGLAPIKEMPDENVIRLTQVENHIGPSSIKFYEIVFDGLTESKIRYVESKIDSTLKMQATAELNTTLGERDLKYLMKSIESAEAEEITYFTKTEQYESFLVELKRGNNYTVLERSAGYERDKKYKSKYSDLILTIEGIRIGQQRKRAKR